MLLNAKIIVGQVTYSKVESFELTILARLGQWHVMWCHVRHRYINSDGSSDEHAWRIFRKYSTIRQSPLLDGNDFVN